MSSNKYEVKSQLEAETFKEPTPIKPKAFRRLFPKTKSVGKQNSNHATKENNQSDTIQLKI